MPQPAANLPGHDLARKYREGATYRSLAVEYKTTPATVRKYIKLWCEANGVAFPLRVWKGGYGKHVHDVDAALYVRDIARAVLEHRITQKALAESVGLNPGHLYKVTSGHTTRIAPATARLIDKALELAAKGKHEPMKAVGLKALGRAHCVNAHPYRGHRDKDGVRYCPSCRAANERRKSA